MHCCLRSPLRRRWKQKQRPQEAEDLLVRRRSICWGFRKHWWCQAGGLPNKMKQQNKKACSLRLTSILFWRRHNEAAGGVRVHDPGGGEGGGDQWSSVPVWDDHPLPDVRRSPWPQTTAPSTAGKTQNAGWEELVVPFRGLDYFLFKSIRDTIKIMIHSQE